MICDLKKSLVLSIASLCLFLAPSSKAQAYDYTWGYYALVYLEDAYNLAAETYQWDDQNAYNAWYFFYYSYSSAVIAYADGWDAQAYNAYYCGYYGVWYSWKLYESTGDYRAWWACMYGSAGTWFAYWSDN